MNSFVEAGPTRNRVWSRGSIRISGNDEIRGSTPLPRAGRGEAAGGVADQILTSQDLQPELRSGMVGIAGQGGDIPRGTEFRFAHRDADPAELVADLGIVQLLAGLAVQAVHLRDEGAQFRGPGQVVLGLGGPAEPAVG